MHAVAAQQETVVQRDRLSCIVETHFRLHSQRAVEGVRAASAVLAHMVGGEASHALATQPVGARIPDMKQVGGAAAQHQRCQRATHSGELGVLAAHGIDPAVERVDDFGARALHLHGLGQIAESVQEAAHRSLGRNAAALRAADAVGDRGDQLLARLGQLRAQQGAGEIFVVLARPGLRGESDARPHPGLNRRHRTVSIGFANARNRDEVPTRARLRGRGFPPSPRFLRTATTMSKIAPRARRNTYRKIAGFAVELVVAAVLGIEPGDLGLFDIGRIGIDGGFTVIDHNLPGRAAHRIGTGERAHTLLRVTVDRKNSQTSCEASYPCR